MVAGCGGGGASSGPVPPPADSTPPSAPQAVIATAESATQVRVSWQASTDAGSGVAGYRVFRDGSVTPIATVTVTNHVDVNLAPGTGYTYTVRAFDAAYAREPSGASPRVPDRRGPAPVCRARHRQAPRHAAQAGPPASPFAASPMTIPSAQAMWSTGSRL